MPGRSFGGMRGVAAVMGLTMILAACDDMGRVTSTLVDPAYDPGELGYAARDGLTLRILGNPSEEASASFERKVASIMGRVHAGPDMRFDPAAANDPPSRYRVVMVFNAATPVTDPELCRNEIPPVRGLGDEITVRAVFCRDSKPLTGAIGIIDYDDGSDERKFQRFMLDVANTLFPVNPGNDRS